MQPVLSTSHSWTQKGNGMCLCHGCLFVCAGGGQHLAWGSQAISNCTTRTHTSPLDCESLKSLPAWSTFVAPCMREDFYVVSLDNPELNYSRMQRNCSSLDNEVFTECPSITEGEPNLNLTRQRGNSVSCFVTVRCSSLKALQFASPCQERRHRGIHSFSPIVSIFNAHKLMKPV